jgi:hypothetical protein
LLPENVINIASNAEWKEPNKALIFKLIKDAIPASIFPQLITACETLVHSQKPASMKKSSRKEETVYHFGTLINIQIINRFIIGVWRLYSKDPYVTADSKTDSGKEFIGKLTELVQVVSHLVQVHFPELYNIWR